MLQWRLTPKLQILEVGIWRISSQLFYSHCHKYILANGHENIAKTIRQQGYWDKQKINPCKNRIRSNASGRHLGRFLQKHLKQPTGCFALEFGVLRSVSLDLSDCAEYKKVTESLKENSKMLCVRSTFTWFRATSGGQIALTIRQNSSGHVRAVFLHVHQTRASQLRARRSLEIHR